MDLRTYSKVLFPISCLLLVFWGFGHNAFESNLAKPSFLAIFGLLIIEAVLLIAKSHNIWWARIKWLVLALLLLLTLIG